MTHSDHDLDLLAGLGSGADREQAESMVASCLDCATEYRSQLAIKQLLAQVPGVSLTETEAMGLTRSVMSQLSAPVVDLAAARARKPLSPVWGRLTAVAAALAGFVLIGTVIVSGGGDSSATTAGPAAFEAMVDEDPQDRLSLTTGAAATTSQATGGEDASILAADESIDALGIQARELLAQVESEGAPSATTAAAEPLAYEETCPTLAEFTVLASAEATLDQRPVVILIVDSDTEPLARAFYTDDCAEIALPD